MAILVITAIVLSILAIEARLLLLIGRHARAARDAPRRAATPGAARPRS